MILKIVFIRKCGIVINYSLILFAFLGGWFLHKYKEKIFSYIRTFIFILRNYRNIYGKGSYNDFFETKFSDSDFMKDGDSFDE